MTKKRLVRAALFCLALCLALGTKPVSITAFQEQLGPMKPVPRGHYVRFPESRAELPGKVWLAWPRPFQRWVAETLINGYQRGYDEGCLKSTGQLPQKPGERVQTYATKCPPLYPRDKDPVLDSIKCADEITEFYKRYPGDMDVPFHYLGYMLVGSGSKSIDEIHKLLSSDP